MLMGQEQETKERLPIMTPLSTPKPGTAVISRQKEKSPAANCQYSVVPRFAFTLGHGSQEKRHR